MMWIIIEHKKILWIIKYLFKRIIWFNNQKPNINEMKIQNWIIRLL